MSALRARLQALFAGVQRWYAGHSRRDQRIVLAVLAFVGICVVYLWGWVPLRAYRQSVADEIADGQEQLARDARVLGSADSLRADRESLEKKLKQMRTRLLPGRGGTLGAAALQERTNSLAAEKGMTVQSTQVMKEEGVDPYRKVSVRLTLSGELKPFADLLSGLEYGQQLAIPFLEANRRGAVPGAKGPRTIAATIEVTGFVLGEEAKADEAPPPEGAETAEGPPVEGAATTTTVPAETAAAPEGTAEGATTTTVAKGALEGATTSTAAKPAAAGPTTTVAAAVPSAPTTTSTHPPGSLPMPNALKPLVPPRKGQKG